MYEVRNQRLEGDRIAQNGKNVKKRDTLHE
jgi:hypothetical protein